MILRRYIIRQVSTTTALVLGFLVVMLLGGRLIRYFGIAAEGGLQTDLLFLLIGYNLPYFLELILPVSFFIALMLTFGRLYADSEMAILNASGISRGQLGFMLLPLLAVLFIFQAYLTLVGKPWGVRSADNVWQTQSLAKVFDLVRPKEFITSGNYHLYVGELGENRSYLSDVIIIETKTNATDTPENGQTPPKDTLIFAERATQVPTDDSTVQLDLHHGRRYELNPKSQGYNRIGFERYRISLETKEAILRPAKIEGVPTNSLLEKKDSESLAELGYRLSLPWLMVLAVLYALPLSRVNPRQGRWLKLVPAIFVFVVVALVLISLKKPIEKQKVGVWAYPVALMILFAVAIYMNHHSHLKLSLKSRGRHG
ncbi:MAG: LPS export ABC transporter permease LptF [Moraxella sp.]|nr:LPS export ABC transporter permease LptF [Moraxella sp.]